MRSRVTEYDLTIEANAEPVFRGESFRMRVVREQTVILRVTFDCDEAFAQAFLDFCRGRGVDIPGRRELPSAAMRLPPAPIDGVFDDSEGEK